MHQPDRQQHVNTQRGQPTPACDLKLLVLDVDGVLTDAGIYLAEDGTEIKRFNARDGIAIKRLLNSGFEVGFLTSSMNDALVRRRAHMIGVERVSCGREPKLPRLQAWCEELNIEMSAVAYIGDDVNDLEVIERCGLTACPADAVSRIKRLAHFTLNTPGGHGCVREFIEDFLSEECGLVL